MCQKGKYSRKTNGLLICCDSFLITVDNVKVFVRKCIVKVFKHFFFIKRKVKIIQYSLLFYLKLYLTLYFLKKYNNQLL